MNKLSVFLKKAIPFFLGCVVFAVIALSIYGIYTPDDGIEAYMGDFSSESFNEEWKVYLNDEPVDDFVIPGKISAAKKGDTIRLVRNLPEDIHDGMSLMMKTSLEEMYIFINGTLRSSYTLRDAIGSGEYLQSSYLAADLTKEDAGKIIEIRIAIQNRGVVNEIVISNGNNAWFEVLDQNIHLNLFAFAIVAIGALVIVACFLLSISGRVQYNKSVFYLGIIMFEIGIWMFAESRLKQFIFAKASVASILTYLTIESVGAIVVMYFDEVQHRKYHKINTVFEYLIIIQLAVNTLLHFSGAVHYHDSLIFSHIWMGFGIAVLIFNLVRDVRIRAVKEYAFVASGMLFFLMLCVIEIWFYYLDGSARLGVFVCIGLIVLLIATTVQIVYDVNANFLEREKHYEDMAIATLETIANAIDAKDEYTGGHSTRVGTYAAILAKEMMSEYNLTEADVNRIQYIGLMHDIGKIGVPDTILNKAGRLTHEEFSLMKKHVAIGYELLGAVGDSMPGLLDGVKYHHERYDGRGYPDGIAGEAIPLIARILCLADCYDAMTSNRVYRHRLTDEQVRDEFVRCRGSQFDPKLTDIFIGLIDKGELTPVEDYDDDAATDKDELKSLKLEKMITKTLLSGEESIINPGHIRMMCYIAKLMEKKGTRVDIVLAELEGDNLCSEPGQTDLMHRNIAPFLKRYDINVEYTDTKHAIAFINRSDDEIELFLKSMAKVQGMKIEVL